MTRPFLQAALAGEWEVPEQRPFIEGWLAYALYSYEGLCPLDEVLGWADAWNHEIPDPDEVSWAFLRLRKRGWLAIEGEMYGLTPEGRRAVKEIVSRGKKPHLLLDQVRKLEKCFSDNPLPDENKAEIWRAETKVFVKNPESEYRRLEESYMPFLQAALAGEREVPPPRGPRIEVWFAHALGYRDGMHPLWEIIKTADELLIRIPHYDEVSWAFLRLRRRGWLIVDGERFGLTPEGRRVIQEIRGRDDDMYWKYRGWGIIEKWMSEHPLPGDV
jgi:hypothetical protein